MPDMNERLDGVERTLTTLTEHVEEQFTQVDQRFAQVDERFEALTTEVQKLRVLGEENAARIQVIAEVQAHHGDVLEQHGAALQRIEEALEPLKAVSVALERILPDHERRIQALEESGSTPRRRP